MAHPAAASIVATGKRTTAVDDKGCDDINDDREHEEWKVPAYGIDQSTGPLSLGWRPDGI